MAGVRGARTATTGALGPVGQRLELAEELVLAPHRLLERRVIERQVAQPPAALVVAGGLAVLHLEDEQAVLRVGDDEVRLAVLGRSTVAHRPGPLDVGVQAVLGRQRGPQPLGDQALGVLPSGHAKEYGRGAEAWAARQNALVLRRALGGVRHLDEGIGQIMHDVAQRVRKQQVLG